MLSNVLIFISVLVKVLSDTLDISEICLDCLSKNVTAMDSQCIIPLCPTNSGCSNKSDLKNHHNEIREPVLLCRDDYSLTFSWNQTKNFYMKSLTLLVFIQYADLETNTTWTSNFTFCNWLTISKLKSNTKYDITMFAIAPLEGKVYKSRTIKAQTLAPLKKISPVLDLKYKLSWTEQTYAATLNWNPSIDLSCIYEIVWRLKQGPADHEQRKINLKKYGKTEFNLTNLQYGKTYVVSIMSIDRNGVMESTKKFLNILVPSCLDTFENLTICPPNKPQNLSCNIEYIDNGTFNQTNLKLTWNKPTLQPDYYIVSFVSFNETLKSNFTATAKTPGDKNSALLQNISRGIYHIVKLVAYSKGGTSDAARMNMHIKTSTTSLNSTISAKKNYNAVMDWVWTSISILVIGVILYLFRQKLKYLIMNCIYLTKNLEGVTVRYTTDEPEKSKWELSESKLLIDKVIGFGAFGIVQKGYYYLEHNKKSEVAVKTLKANPTVEQITQFYDEIEIMKSVPRHPHIVYLIGVITKHRPSNPLMLVEFCARGDLKTFLKKLAFVLNEKTEESNLIKDGSNFFNKCYDMDMLSLVEDKKFIESKDLLSFARQIVVGMEFLSSLKVIHRDLAARNVLITNDNTLKISDFGLSRDIYTNNIYKKVTGGKLPFRWMALESLTHQIYTTGSDVWSFGIVLWEIATLGGNPYPTVHTEDLVILLKSGYRMEKPINCSDELYKLMCDCWQASPSLRPSFKDLRETFDKLLESETQYIDLEDAKKLDFSQYENLKSEEHISERYIVRNGNIL